MDLASIESKTQKFLCPTYTRYPLAVQSARGCRLYDFEGREYIDLLAGISVCNLGHSHPEIVDCIKRQAEKLIHVSNLFYQEEQVLLAEKLLKTCGLERTFFCNSGAEANEAAIKLTRRYMNKVRKENRFELITFSGSFHGRTLATLSATGQERIKQGFEPLPHGFKNVPFNDVLALEDAVNEHTAAIMIECIQGEGGIRTIAPELASTITKLQEERKLLLIVDEIQTGLGRTGTFWAHEQFGLEPDMITSSKALAAGLPMGALLASDELAHAFGPGSHGTTFGGGALVSATGLKALEIIERDNLVRQSFETGIWAGNLFEELAVKYPGHILEVRGSGLMIGIELAFPGQEVWKSLLEQGFVLNLTQDTVLRLLPPLIISRQDIQAFAQALDTTLSRINITA